MNKHQKEIDETKLLDSLYNKVLGLHYYGVFTPEEVVALFDLIQKKKACDKDE